MTINKRMKYRGRLVLRLTNQEVRLAVFGAREMQETPQLDLSATAKHGLTQGEAVLTHMGAKLYKLGGGWWQLCGYGYKVMTNMPHRYPSLKVDERDTMRMLGFAI